jgi:hypothetical protein
MVSSVATIARKVASAERTLLVLLPVSPDSLESEQDDVNNPSPTPIAAQGKNWRRETGVTGSSSARGPCMQDSHQMILEKELSPRTENQSFPMTHAVIWFDGHPGIDRTSDAEGHSGSLVYNDQFNHESHSPSHSSRLRFCGIRQCRDPCEPLVF